jgi:hypothetical protein
MLVRESTHTGCCVKAQPKNAIAAALQSMMLTDGVQEQRSPASSQPWSTAVSALGWPIGWWALGWGEWPLCVVLCVCRLAAAAAAGRLLLGAMPQLPQQLPQLTREWCAAAAAAAAVALPGWRPTSGCRRSRRCVCTRWLVGTQPARAHLVAAALKQRAAAAHSRSLLRSSCQHWWTHSLPGSIAQQLAAVMVDGCHSCAAVGRLTPASATSPAALTPPTLAAAAGHSPSPPGCAAGGH